MYIKDYSLEQVRLLIRDLMDTYHFNTYQMRQLFYRESGLLGVSGFSADMRDLLASDKPEAKLAVDIFVHRIVIYTGLLAAELQGFDGFIFTAGIGENAAPIREKVCDCLEWLGVHLDKDKNHQQKNIFSHIKIFSNNSANKKVLKINIYPKVY